MKIAIGLNITEIDRELLRTEHTIDVNFNGAVLIQIIKYDGQWSVNNAMDGYGNNCVNDYENEKVHLLED